MKELAEEQVRRVARVLRVAVRAMMVLWVLRFVYRFMDGQPIAWTPIALTFGVAAVMLWKRTREGDLFADEDAPCDGDGRTIVKKMQRKKDSTIVMLRLRHIATDGTTYAYDGPFDTAEQELDDFLRRPETW